MKPKTKGYFIIFVVVLLLALTGCDRFIYIQGNVLESKGGISFCGVVYEEGKGNNDSIPIEGVKVMLGKGGESEDRGFNDETTYTNKKGEFKFLCLSNFRHSNVVELSFRKDGYISITQKVILSAAGPTLGKEKVKCYLAKEK